MLNYVWLGLVVIGILTAAGRDLYDSIENVYGNERSFPVHIEEQTGPGEWNAWCTANELQRKFSGIENTEDTTRFVLSFARQSSTAGVLRPESGAPAILLTVQESFGDNGSIPCRITSDSSRTGLVYVSFSPIRFVYLKRVTNAALDAAALAVKIALGLIGIMALWLGVMKVAEEAGIIAIIARAVRPITTRLFSDIPEDHPAIGAMIMNISANMLGLGNAATPFGLKAMEELDKLNKHAGTATNAMVTFLALNTSCVTLVPATAIAVRAATGSSDPAIIIGTTFLTSLVATVFAVVFAKVFQRLSVFRVREKEAS